MKNLTSADLDDLAKFLPLIKDWISEIEKDLERRLFQGEEFKNVKLVDKMPRRRWINEDDAKATLLALDYTIDQVAPRVLISPSQAEELLGRASYFSTVAPNVSKESSGMTLAYADDKRIAKKIFGKE